MILQIDFSTKVILLQGATLKDIKGLPKIIEAAGYKPEDFEIGSFVEFDNNNTAEAQVLYEPPNDEVN